MVNHTSRKYQNILHISGSLYSILTILGALLIGKENYTLGLFLMAAGAIFIRITSEIEYQKQTQLFREFDSRKNNDK